MIYCSSDVSLLSNDDSLSFPHSARDQSILDPFLSISLVQAVFRSRKQ